MNDEERTSQEEREQELWREVSQSEGADRAEAITALGRILWDKSKYKESLAFCESARDLYLEAGRESYLDELTDVNFGIMNNFDMLDRSREAAEAAAAIVELYKETDHPMLGELLRDEGRYWFSAGEVEKSLERHLEAIAIVDPDQSEIGRGVDLLNVGMARKRLGHYIDAIENLKDAIAIFKAEKNPSWVSKCHGELTEIYTELEMPDEIEEWARKALDFAELTGNGRWEYWLNYYIGVARKIKGDLDSAEEFLAKAKHQAVQSGDQDWNLLIKIEKEIAGIDVIRGKVSQAEEALRRVATIEETLLAS
jgi:tetratricopeptide (TPR) repeat protein